MRWKWWYETGRAAPETRWLYPDPALGAAAWMAERDYEGWEMKRGFRLAVKWFLITAFVVVGILSAVDVGIAAPPTCLVFVDKENADYLCPQCAVESGRIVALIPTTYKEARDKNSAAESCETHFHRSTNLCNSLLWELVHGEPYPSPWRNGQWKELQGFLGSDDAASSVVLANSSS